MKKKYDIKHVDDEGMQRMLRGTSKTVPQVANDTLDAQIAMDEFHEVSV